MLLLDLLGRRWTLRILWEIRAGADTFAAISARCERISPTVLTRRLGELVEADLLVKDGRRYLPTEAARELGEFLVPMDEWAKRWVAARDDDREESA